MSNTIKGTNASRSLLIAAASSLGLLAGAANAETPAAYGFAAPKTQQNAAQANAAEAAAAAQMAQASAQQMPGYPAAMQQQYQMPMQGAGYAGYGYPIPASTLPLPQYGASPFGATQTAYGNMQQQQFGGGVQQPGYGAMQQPAAYGMMGYGAPAMGYGMQQMPYDPYAAALTGPLYGAPNAGVPNYRGSAFAPAEPIYSPAERYNAAQSGMVAAKAIAPAEAPKTGLLSNPSTIAEMPPVPPQMKTPAQGLPTQSAANKRIAALSSAPVSGAARGETEGRYVGSSRNIEPASSYEAIDPYASIASQYGAPSLQTGAQTGYDNYNSAMSTGYAQATQPAGNYIESGMVYGAEGTSVQSVASTGYAEPSLDQVAPQDIGYAVSGGTGLSRYQSEALPLPTPTSGYSAGSYLNASAPVGHSAPTTYEQAAPQSYETVASTLSYGEGSSYAAPAHSQTAMAGYGAAASTYPAAPASAYPAAPANYAFNGNDAYAAATAQTASAMTAVQAPMSGAGGYLQQPTGAGYAQQQALASYPEATTSYDEYISGGTASTSVATTAPSAVSVGGYEFANSASISEQAQIFDAPTSKAVSFKAPARRSVSGVPAASHFVQVAAFRDIARAERLAAKLQAQGQAAFTVAARVRGKIYHRVRVPAQGSRQAKVVRNEIRELGYYEARIIKG